MPFVNGVMINPFATDAFNLVALSSAIGILPNKYGRLNQLNLFPVKGQRLRTIIFEERHGVLTLLPTLPIGSPGTQASRAMRKVRSFTIPHIPHDDVLLPQDFEGIREFGSENVMASLVSCMNNKLQAMRNKHDITLEWLRVGALKGNILDADGVSVIYNLFDEFQIPQFAVDFVLGTSTTDVKKKCLTVRRHIETSLHGETMTGDPRVLCCPEFFDELTSHANVKAAFQNWSAAAQMLAGDQRAGFPFGSLIFEEYIGQAMDSSGNVHRFFDPVNYAGVAFPEGTTETFATYVAPADFLETVNTLGQFLYAKQEPRDFNRGIDIHTQSNPLPICSRPGVLVKCFSSN